MEGGVTGGEETKLLTVALGNSGHIHAILWNHKGDKIDQYHFPWDQGADPQGSVATAKMNATDQKEQIVGLMTTEECKTQFQILAGTLLPPCDIVLSGVVPAKLSILEEMLQSCWAGLGKIWRFHKEIKPKGVLPCPLVVKPTPSQNVGEDRLASCVGALSLSPRASWVVVDSGTALTLNVVTPYEETSPPQTKTPIIGTFEGGLILPGERLMLESLWRGTAQLPELKHWPLPDENQENAPPLVGTSTNEAIRAGVRLMQIHGATGIALSQAESLSSRGGGGGEQVRCAITGGGSAQLWPSFREKLSPYNPIRDLLLVHRGLCVTWRLYHGLPLPSPPAEI